QMSLVSLHDAFPIYCSVAPNYSSCNICNWTVSCQVINDHEMLRIDAIGQDAVCAYAQPVVPYATQRSSRDLRTTGSPAPHSHARWMAWCTPGIPVSRHRYEILRPGIQGCQLRRGQDDQSPRSWPARLLLPR